MWLISWWRRSWRFHGFSMGEKLTPRRRMNERSNRTTHQSTCMCSRVPRAEPNRCLWRWLEGGRHYDLPLSLDSSIIRTTLWDGGREGLSLYIQMSICGRDIVIGARARLLGVRVRSHTFLRERVKVLSLRNIRHFTTYYYTLICTIV